MLMQISGRSGAAEAAVRAALVDADEALILFSPSFLP